MIVHFDPIELPGQRIIHGNTFPLVLKINKKGGEVTLQEAADATRDLSGRGITTELLNKHGAVIFRGVPDPSPYAMSVLVHAVEEGRGHFPYDQLGLAGSRTVHDKEIFSASEAPPEVWIHQHNEYSRCTKFPSNIHFYCHKAPPKGGESPSAHSPEFFGRINEELPDFVKELATQGLDSPDV